MSKWDSSGREILAADWNALQDIPASVAALADGTLPIEYGGTGETTAADALTALLPAQSSATIDYVLQSDGTDASWAAISGGGSSANPSATIGLSAVNGTATTFMTSDSAPALSQAIAPTWTGVHQFQGTNPIRLTGAGTGAQYLGVENTSGWAILGVEASTGGSLFTGGSAYATGIGSNTATNLEFGVDGYVRGLIDTTPQAWFYEPSFGATALKTVATYDSGSFTGTLTGMTTATTGTVYWVRSGPMVTLYVGAGFTGTSNATTMTMTGLPTALQAAKEQFFSSICYTSGEYTDCMTMVAASSGTITFYVGTTGVVGGELSYTSGEFANSGTKGLIGWSVTYSLV